MDAQLKRGILNICILRLLRDDYMYGYDVVKNLQQYFPETEESTIYAIMRRMYREGLTELCYEMPSAVSTGRKRKYYKLTEAGKQQLDEYLSELEKISDILFQTPKI